MTLNTYSPTTGWDILRIGAGATTPQPILTTGANEGEGGASVSGDGKWLAYTSDATGTNEIYVQPYPGPGGAVRVSRNGGSDPLFSTDGHELYYWEATQLMAVSIESGTTFSRNPPKLLFDSGNLHVLPGIYDVSPNGRFLMIRPSDKVPIPSPITLIANWTASLHTDRP